MKKKIILFIPLIEDGGVEKNFFNISKYLKSISKDLKIITFSKKRLSFINNSFFKKLENNFHLLIRRIKILICLIDLMKTINKNENSIVLSFQANIYCIIICKLLGTKIIIRSNASITGWTNNILKKHIYKYIYSLADKIVVNSKELKREFALTLKLKSICIYNPINKKEILRKSKEKFDLYKFNRKIVNIVSVGRLVEQKDHLTTINAIGLLKNKYNIKLLIIGSGPLKKFLNNKINYMGLKNNVKIIDYIKNPYPYIKNGDLFILSSKFEGLPNVLLEAIVLNKFSISSNCQTGPKEILDNGKGGFLFKVGNFKSLAKKIETFIKFKKKLSKKRMYASSRLDRFNYDDRLKDYLTILT